MSVTPEKQFKTEFLAQVWRAFENRMKILFGTAEMETKGG
jgi:hypothetical protein